jgi:predicted Zn-dependent protease
MIEIYVRNPRDDIWYAVEEWMYYFEEEGITDINKVDIIIKKDNQQIYPQNVIYDGIKIVKLHP